MGESRTWSCCDYGSTLWSTKCEVLIFHPRCFQHQLGAWLGSSWAGIFWIISLNVAIYIVLQLHYKPLCISLWITHNGEFLLLLYKTVQVFICDLFHISLFSTLLRVWYCFAVHWLTWALDEVLHSFSMTLYLQMLFIYSSRHSIKKMWMITVIIAHFLLSYTEGMHASDII